jgi:tetratricopeptide (TPR) repeat protein
MIEQLHPNGGTGKVLRIMRGSPAPTLGRDHPFRKPPRRRALYIIPTAQYHRGVSPDHPARSWWKSFEARLLLGALFLRLLYLATILDNPYFTVPVTDEAMYDSWARTIVAGGTFLHYPYYDSPLHAFFLASVYWLFGHSFLAVRLVQVALGVLNVLLLYRIALRLADPLTARITGLLAAAYLPFLYYEGLLEKESVALCLLDASVLLALGALARPTALAFWCAGAVLGLLALSRINALALAPLILTVVWLHLGNRAAVARATGALLLGLVMIIAPVTLRNRLVSGEWIPITVSGGQVLYTANNPDNPTGELSPVPGVRSTSLFERIDFHRKAEAETGRAMTPGEVSAYWGRKSLEFSLGHPAAQARMVGHRFLQFWNKEELADNHSIDQFKQFSWVLRAPLPGYWFVAPLAIAGLVLAWPRRRALALPYMAVGGYLLSLLPFWISSRYRVPIAGLLIFFAALALAHVIRIRRDAGADAGRRIAMFALGLVAAAALCWQPMSRSHQPTLERNLAYAHEQIGEYDRAIAIYERLRAAERNPENELYLANALGLAGRTVEAKTLLAQLAGPGNSREVRRHALMFQGDLARRQAKWDEAAGAFRSVLVLNQADYEAWNELAKILLAQERLDDAEQALRASAKYAPQDEWAGKMLDWLLRYRAARGKEKS